MPDRNLKNRGSVDLSVELDGFRVFSRMLIVLLTKGHCVFVKEVNMPKLQF